MTGQVLGKGKHGEGRVIVIAIDEWKCKKKVNGRWTLLMVVSGDKKCRVCGEQCSCGNCPRSSQCSCGNCAFYFSQCSCGNRGSLAHSRLHYLFCRKYGCR